MNAERVRVGGYQILTLLLLSINFITVSMSHALSIFYKYTPRFYCQTLDAGNRTYGCVPGGCAGGYAFESGPRGYERSVATDWQLVCERGRQLRALGELYFAGLLLGGLLAGFLADRLGRLPVLAVCLYAQGIMAVALNVVENFQLFLLFRGLQGFFMQGLESCTFVLCMELFPTKYRTLVAMVMLSIRSLGFLIISGFSYFIPDWRILQLIASVPTAVTVLYIWLIPESPRWLLAKGKTLEAQMLLERVAKYNSLLGFGKSDNNDAGSKQARLSDCEDLHKQDGKAANVQATGEHAKSIEESETLLSNNVPDSVKDEKERVTSSIEKNEADGTVTLTVVADEQNGCKSKNDKTSSYTLMTKETFSVDESDEEKRPRGLLGVLRARFIGRTCVLLMFSWFASSQAFHGLVSLPYRPTSDRHASLFLAAGMEICTFGVAYLLTTSRLGRRWSLGLSQLLGGSVCVAIAILAIAYPTSAPVSATTSTTAVATTAAAVTAPTLRWLASAKIVVVTLGRVVNIVSFFILRLVMIELLPTISRATGVGLCIGAEMIGGLLMPFILILNRFVPELGRLVIGITCICAALLSIYFPETLRTVLPDSAREARSLVQNRDQKSPEVLREKLFSGEDWIEAGNGIVVNFTENKSSE